MSERIIGMQPWFETPPGRYLAHWEQETLDQAVADLFGYHALQLGLPVIEALRANRMSHHWLALPPGEADAGRVAHLRSAYDALPFDAASLDLVVLPHALEMSPDPHATLREVERVLVPEGRVIITAFNPASLWGLRQRRAHLLRRLGVGRLYLPEAGEFLAWRRLRDWLRLLDFEVESHRFGCWRPALSGQAWLERFAWMDGVGERGWPFFGAAHCIVAVKRVRGARLLGATWKRQATMAGATVPLARKASADRREAAPLSPDKL
jgi:SAM-dependent methyltransferase